MHGWRRGGFPYLCDKTAPTLLVEASTSTTKGRLGSGRQRVGAEQNFSLRWWKACRASGLQDRDLDCLLIIEVSGEAMVLKLVMNQRKKLAKPKKLEFSDGGGLWPGFDCFHLPLVHFDSVVTDDVAEELDGGLMKGAFFQLEVQLVLPERL